MRSKVLRSMMLGMIVALANTIHAQEAVVSGTMTDSTGGVLPGVTVTAFHEATGNTFVAVTDERGTFRLPVRTGVFRITAELSGFTSINRTVELLVGQQVVINLQMVPSTVQESVTVTGEAPLIDVASSTLGTNIDPRQMQDLPLNGRNWMDLTVLAAGSRTNAVSGEVPSHNTSSSINFQLNLDGQQVTNSAVPSFGQPKFSRDAIAEFEFVSNRFSATQGRSSGVQVNAVTRSGTNTPAGSFSGYFRNDRFNAADHVAGRVLPYSDTQLSGTFGGPIVKDRFHYFGNYEYEREPQTYVYTTPYSRFNGSVTGARVEKKGLFRLDFQFSPQTRLSGRGSKYVNRLPYDPRYSGGSDRTMGSLIGVDRFGEELLLNFTQVLGARTVNEIRVGKNFFDNYQYSHARNPNSLPGQTPGFGAPRIIFQGFTLGQTHDRTPQDLNQEVYSVRDDFTYSYNKGGRHDLRVGGEYLHHFYFELGCALCVGTLDLQGGPIPANIEDLFPDPLDVSTYNLAPLSPLARSYIRTIATSASQWSRPPGGMGFLVYAPQHIVATWVQDDWTLTPRLTLNLGLRYDLFLGNYANWVPYPPLLEADRPNDTNDVAPRVGFAYSLTNRTVLRGGWGKYYSQLSDIPLLNTVRHAQQITPQVFYDGRSDFPSNPFNGPEPTYEEAWASTCVRSPGRPGCLRPSVGFLVASDLQTSYSHQTSIGVQRQLGSTMSVEADYVFNASRATLRGLDVNLVYNPATGANYPFNDVTKKVYPGWGTMNGVQRTDGKDNYHALQMAFTKRMNNRWQASATYTLAGQWNFDTLPLNPGCTYPMILTASGSAVCDVPLQLAPDVSENDWYLAGDQRHRATFNGIWDVGYGFQLSGLYLFGENGKNTPVSGVDVRLAGTAGGGRLRPNGTLIARNSFDRSAIHRVDLRVMRRLRLGSRVALDGIFEVFNVFDYANYNAWVLNERNAKFGSPTQETNLGYAPRMLQLGFRATF